MTWDERFSRGEHANLDPMSFVADLARRLPGHGRLLDLACGAGRHSILFSQKGWRVTAVDGSIAALQLVHARDSQIETVHADLATFEIPEPGTWDLILVTLYLQRSLFARIRTAAAPGKTRIAVANPLVDPREGVRPMNPEYLLSSVEDLAREFQGWTIEHKVETNPAPPSRRIAELIAMCG